MSEKNVTAVYAFCITQFAGVLIYVTVFCHPVTRTHVALVTLSAVLGLAISGHVRRSYHENKQKQTGDNEQYLALDEKLKKIRNEENHGQKN